MEQQIDIPDDSTRPKAPTIDWVTDRHRRQGRRLALFHEMHLRELALVKTAMDRVFDGSGSAQTLVLTISSMQMVANMRLFGTMCGQACAMLTGHHSIEDQWVFPALENRTDGLNKVIERLRAEHLVIHQLLVQMEAAAHTLITEPGTANAASLQLEFNRLHAFVISHFGYEQTELEEALGFYGVEI
jgi:hypothetical protein